MRSDTLIRSTLIYALLLLGAVVFGWPFIWMASTSFKLEREMFSGRGRTLPESPQPAVRSPYIDERVFADTAGPRMQEVTTMIEQLLSDVPDKSERRETARGIYARLLTVLPAEAWKKPGEQLKTLIAPNLTTELVNEIRSQLRHAFCIGQLRADSYDLQEQQLVAPANAAQTWQVAGAGSLVPGGTPLEPFAELHYDFSQGDKVTLSQTFTTSFPVSRLHRLQLYLKNDNAWHAINLQVEKSGALYRAAHAVDDADINWVVDTWQERGPDDRPEKIRSWTLLHETARGPQFVNGADQIKITLELSQRKLWQAWAAKISRNYRLTLDYIPFWRYVATSLFLILLNLCGTLFSCSLVAYAFARLRWPGRTICFALLLATMMIPPQVTMIPQFLIFQKLGWYNTLKPLWAMSFFASAFSVFLIHQFLKGIPRDLEDAARLDGCGFLRVYWHVMLPLIKPTLAVVGIFTVLATWNEFMMPLIYLSDQRLYPLSFGLYAFQIQSLQPGTSAGISMVMAGSLLMTLPVIAVFFFAQRYFLQGVTLTGMKG